MVPQRHEVTAIANPFSTGGGGISFEHLVAATYLVSLLAGDIPRGFDVGVGYAIRFQTRHLGAELDDLMIVAKNDSLIQRLALQVKHSASLPPKSSKWLEFLTPAWKMWSRTDGPDPFRKGEDRLGLAVGSLQAQVEDHLLPILEWARSSTDEEDFFSKVATPVYAHKNKRKYLEAIREALSLSAGREIEPRVLWQFLRDFLVLHFDLGAEGSRDATYAWNRLLQLYGDPQKAFTAFRILVAEAAFKAPVAGTIDRDGLDTLLIEKARLTPLERRDGSLESSLHDFLDYLRNRHEHLPLSGLPLSLSVDLPLKSIYVDLYASPLSTREAGRRLPREVGSDLERARVRRLELRQRLEHLNTHLLFLNDVISRPSLHKKMTWKADREWEKEVELSRVNTGANRQEKAQRAERSRIRSEIQRVEQKLRELERMKPVPLDEVVKSRRTLLIVGGAGSGKSTFLRHLVLQSTASRQEALAILAPLSRVDAMLAQGGARSFLESVLDLQVEHVAGRSRSSLRAAIEREVECNRVLFLLDGLDEVKSCLGQIVAGIEELSAQGHRVVVTTRPLEELRLANFRTYRLLPLDLPEAHAFLARWFRAFARVGAPKPGDQEEWADHRSAWARQQIEGTLTLGELARNPLMLTLIAILAATGDAREGLPKSRVDLYSQYLDRLLSVWEQARGLQALAIADTQGKSAQVLAVWVLSWIALRFQESGEPWVRRDALEAELRAALQQKFHGDYFTVVNRAAEALRLWQGLGLIEIQQDGAIEVVSIRYLGIQEFCAARFLAQQIDSEDILFARIETHARTREWENILTFLLELLPDATRFARFFLSGDTKKLGVRRDDTRGFDRLDWVTVAIAEGARVEESLRREVVSELVAAVRATDAGALSRLALMSGPEIDQELLSLLNDESLGKGLRLAVARALGRRGLVEEAAGFLLPLSEDPAASSELCLEAGAALGYLGKRERAGLILYELASGAAKTRKIEPEIRMRAVAQLGALQCVNRLVDLVRAGPRDRSLMLKAINSLIELKCFGEVLSILRDPEVEGSVRLAAAVALGPLGLEESRIAWVSLAEDSSLALELRREAVRFLLQGKAAPSLREIAERPDVDVRIRFAAIRAMEKSGAQDAATASLLAICGESRQPDPVRIKAVRNLFRLGAITEITSIGRESALPTSLRLEIVERLRKLGEKETAGKVLEELYRSPEALNQNVRKVARTLIALGQSERAAELVEQVVLCHDAGVVLRLEAAEDLCRILLKRNRARLGEVLQTLGSDHSLGPEGRNVVAGLLEGIGRRDLAFDLLLDLMKDSAFSDAEMIAQLVRRALECGQDLRAREICRRAVQMSILEPKMRLDAFEVLVGYDDPESVASLLCSLMTDYEIAVELRSLALETHCGLLSTEHLLALIKDEDLEELLGRQAVETVAARNGAPDLLALLESGLPKAELRTCILREVLRSPRVRRDVLLSQRELPSSLAGPLREPLGSLLEEVDSNALTELATAHFLDLPLRVEACRMLMRRGLPKARDVFLAILLESEESDDLQRPATTEEQEKILTGIGRDRSRSAQLRILVALALWFFWRSDESTLILKSMARDTSLAMSPRKQALQALGDTGAVKALLGLMCYHRLEEELQVFCAEVLGVMEFRDGDAVRELKSFFERGRVRPSIRRAARSIERRLEATKRETTLTALNHERTGGTS